MHKTRPPVLVLGSGVTALGVIRSLGVAGIPSRVLESGDPLLRRSRWFVPAAGADGMPSQGGLDGYLTRSEVEGAVLIPCSDSSALEVAGLDRDLAMRFPSSATSTGSLELLTDKARFASTLQELRLPHPRTTSVPTACALRRLPAELLANAFLKPCDSQSFFRRFQKKAFVVHDSDSAAARLAEAQQCGMEMILQEYIPGPANNHYFIDGFVDRDGRVRALFARRRLRMYPPRFGNSTFMVSVPLTEAAPACETVRELLAAIGYRGIFSAELKLDPRDGQFKLLEVNARAWWYVEFATRCGVNVCDLAYRDALHEPVPDIDRYATGVRCVYPYYDFYTCRELLREGHLSSFAWAKSWLGAGQPVFRWNDPLPALGIAGRAVRDRAARAFASRRSPTFQAEV